MFYGRLPKSGRNNSFFVWFRLIQNGEFRVCIFRALQLHCSVFLHVNRIPCRRTCEIATIVRLCNWYVDTERTNCPFMRIEFVQLNISLWKNSNRNSSNWSIGFVSDEIKNTINSIQLTHRPQNKFCCMTITHRTTRRSVNCRGHFFFVFFPPAKHNVIGSFVNKFSLMPLRSVVWNRIPNRWDLLCIQNMCVITIANSFRAFGVRPIYSRTSERNPSKKQSVTASSALNGRTMVVACCGDDGGGGWWWVVVATVQIFHFIIIHIHARNMPRSVGQTTRRTAIVLWEFFCWQFFC